ncbi:transglycosylase SLT domain-containing protein [Chitinispirillales bacterium ANBcel5]|uniref:transglycosylase SLT domain-containing protein n=1 Tax=Cellulosispirillum alkaliphilum TaxID=3039283 RepID=UPI002A58D5FF|nr:transglycosylase SLT domain-containing protein [Chitinispirillales bacterium ANBcel5]
MPYYYLEVTRGTDIGKRYLLSDGALSVGRSRDNNICINPNERIVSSHHAILYKFPDTISIQDMSSTNGVYVNEKRVEQQDLSEGDVVGFGEKGPRLKLIVSEEELPTTSTNKSIEDVSNTEDTEQFHTQNTGLEVKEKESEDLFSNKGTHTPLHNNTDSASLTMEYEKKIISKNITPDEMNKLMKKNERVEKIIQKGNLNQTQTHFLHTAYSAHRKSRKSFFIIIGIIIFLFISVSGYFVSQILHYKSQVNKAVELDKQLDHYESKIAEARQSGADVEEISTLINELETTKNQFNSVKTILRQEDLEQFFQDTVEMFINSILSRFGESDYLIPPNMIERVRFHLDNFSGPLKPTTGRFLQRKENYWPMIERIFTEKKVPMELAYISMLESGFNPTALSHAGAKGLWQFMAHTGRRYGLRVDNIIDDRTDPKKATYAAAEYLKDLISIFGGGRGSLMLAMAAYNAGENRIIGALRQIDDPMRNRDFWYIYRLGILADETNEYIPSIIALMIIDENREHFGFN